MNTTIKRAVVIGSGTMGGGIAAHFANAGVPVYLLDMTQQIVAASLERLKKNKPPAFFTPETASLVTAGNLDEHDRWIGEGDWIVEAIFENLDAKRDLVARIDRLRKPGSIVSSNTSGIPIASIAANASPDLKSHFLGTHFFNPPRYMKLLEIIPTRETSPDVLAFVRDFAEKRLGKGVVLCKDTPNFIANRLASMGGATLVDFVLENGYTVEETDAIVGPLIGRPKTAAFRLQDLVGLDVASAVAANLYDLIPDDESREVLRSKRVEGLRKRQMDQGRLGDKTSQGFYKKTGKEILTLDIDSGEYRARREPEIPSLAEAAKIRSLPERLHFVLKQDDKAGAMARHVVYNALAYASQRVPEISDDIESIDRAVRWGFSHDLGPFELWDALGVKETTEAMEKYGVKVAPWVKGKKKFYDQPQITRTVDNGVRIANVDSDLHAAIDDVESGEWKGLVITSEGADFYSGQSMDGLRKTLDRIRSCSKPVVAAVFGRTLGSGLEIAMAASRIVAAAETYMGLPGIEGAKEMVRRNVNPMMKQTANADPVPLLQNILQAMAKVSSSAEEGRSLGFLTQADRVVMNRDHVLEEARNEVLALASAGYAPRNEPGFAAGRDVRAALHAGIYQLEKGEYLTKEIADMSRQVASALCGEKR